MVGVGLAARKRRLETASRRGLPLAQVLPEQAVEIPDHAIAVRAEIVQVHAAIVGRRRRPDALQRAAELHRQLGGIGLPEIDGNLGERHRLALGIGGSAHADGIAEIGAVLNPVQVDAQGRCKVRVEDAVLDEVHERSGDEAGQLAKLRRFAGLFLGL